MKEEMAEYLTKRLNKIQARIKKLKAIECKRDEEKRALDDLYRIDIEKAFDMKDQLKKLQNKILCGTACKEDKERFINLQAQLIDYMEILNDLGFESSTLYYLCNITKKVWKYETKKIPIM